ncbi:hypothetical protein [Massilia sp. IC2-476]|uniref:hypothetical protein n=1 Tax=Massilia sp. IC2-476 TaxID=2887199 RepID=UPI001D11D337|nr:hypothetical protein [Massilia sp. IC2-476]MCC2974613.1 hypothetical protein [Massilia sp. IC2-476]
MANSQQQAANWLSFLLTQDVPFNELLRSHVAIGKISELCNCGCHGFGFEVPAQATVRPLQEGAGVFYELAFASNHPEEITMLLFTDERGYLSWIDVTYGACNIDPMPDGIAPANKIGVWPGTRHDLPRVDAAD